MKKKIFYKTIVVATLILFVLPTTFAFAGKDMVSFSTTVAGFGGTGYTAFQRKSISGANGWIKYDSVGGGYRISARMIDDKGNVGEYFRDQTTGASGTLPGYYKFYAGGKGRVQFYNAWNTFVNVQAEGSWKSN